MSGGSAYDDYDQPRDDWLRSLLNRVLYILGVVAVFILLTCWFLPLIKEQQRQQRALETLKQQVDQLSKEKKDLTVSFATVPSGFRFTGWALTDGRAGTTPGAPAARGRGRAPSLL